MTIFTDKCIAKKELLQTHENGVYFTFKLFPVTPVAIINPGADLLDNIPIALISG